MGLPASFYQHPWSTLSSLWRKWPNYHSSQDILSDLLNLGCSELPLVLFFYVVLLSVATTKYQRFHSVLKTKKKKSRAHELAQ